MNAFHLTCQNWVDMHNRPATYRNTDMNSGWPMIVIKVVISSTAIRCLLDNLPTNQLAVAGQSSCGLVKSWNSQLADSKLLEIVELLHYNLYTKPNPIHNHNTIKCWQCTNSIIYPKSNSERLYNQSFKSNISASWLVNELISLWLEWPYIGLSVNCLITI